MAESATKITLENLPLEELLQELQKYPPDLWNKSEEKDYSLHEIKPGKNLPLEKKSWCEYLLDLRPYLIVLRKEIIKHRYPADVHSPEKGHFYSDVPKSFRLEVLLDRSSARVHEEDITRSKCRIYRQLERLFEGLGTPIKN